MSTMDFKLKGRNWAGNIYQKFEAMCQEVDDIVRQDKINYVGNQVQNVGESVKKIYSDAVQNLLSPSVNLVKHDTQAVSLKTNAATGNHMESKSSIDENVHDIDYKQSNAELNADDMARTETELAHASSVSGLHFIGEPICVPFLDLIEQDEPILPFEENENFLAYEDSDAGIEKNSNEDPYPLEDPKLLSTLEKSASEEPLCDEFEKESLGKALGIKTDELPSSSHHDDGETMCNGIVDEPDLDPDVSRIMPSSELEFSVSTSGNMNSEIICNSSSCSLSTESYKESAASTEMSPAETWRSRNRNDANMCGSCNSNTFSLSESLQILYCENEAAAMRVASLSSVLPPESSDVDSSRISDAATQSWLFGNSLEQTWGSSQLDSFTSSSEIGRLNDSVDDLADPCMETIELGDEMKLGESCVIVDSDVLHAYSRRAGRLKSYKKLIQDAFASKRRLAKEYEQLAIWYGDLDIDARSSQHSSLQILPSFLPDTSSDLKKIPGQDSRDSEWELL